MSNVKSKFVATMNEHIELLETLSISEVMGGEDVYGSAIGTAKTMVAVIEANPQVNEPALKKMIKKYEVENKVLRTSLNKIKQQ